jgi:hypothetical protein
MEGYFRSNMLPKRLKIAGKLLKIGMNCLLKFSRRTAVGIRCSDGVVLAVEKVIQFFSDFPQRMIANLI